MNAHVKGLAQRQDVKIVKNKQLYIIILIVALSACADSKNENILSTINLPIIEHSEIIVDIKNSNSKQLTLETSIDFPPELEYELYKKYFINNHWQKCVSKIEDLNWYSFNDLTNDSNIKRYRKLTYFINNKMNLLSFLQFEYISSIKNKSPTPDNNKLFITVAIYLESNLDSVIERLKISCGSN